MQSQADERKLRTTSATTHDSVSSALRPAMYPTRGDGGGLSPISSSSRREQATSRDSEFLDTGVDIDSAVIKQGFLLKRGQGWPRKWRKRWFVLRGQTLRYFTNEDCADEKGCIDLRGRPASRVAAAAEPGSFEWEIPCLVKETKGRSYSLRAETENDMMDWIAVVTKWSCDAETQAAMRCADEIYDSLLAEAEARGWVKEELHGLKPAIDSMGQISCVDGSIQLPRLRQEIDTAQFDSSVAANRIRVALALADPAFIGYKQRGVLQLNEKLQPWFFQLVATKNGVLYEVQQWAAALEVDGVSAIKGGNYLELFQLVQAVIFNRRPVATDVRIGYNTYGERLEAEKVVYEDEDWQALHDAYDMMNQLVIAVPSVERRRKLTPAFACKLVELIGSDDARERQALAPVLLSLYVEASSWRESEAASMTLSIDMSAEVALMDGVRFALLRSMRQRFEEFVCETCRKEGVNELLNVLSCILADIDAPTTIEDDLRPEFDRLRDTMLKLHKPYCLMEYHEQLCTCVFHFIGLDIEGHFRTAYIKGLLRTWPWLDSDKEELFIVELEELLDFMSPSEEKELAMPLARVFARIITGPCFCNAKKALEIMLSAGALFNMVTQNAEVFSFMMGAIVRSCEKLVPIMHWDDIETGAVAQQVRDMYTAEFEFTLGADTPIKPYRSSYTPAELKELMRVRGMSDAAKPRQSLQPVAENTANDKGHEDDALASALGLGSSNDVTTASHSRARGLSVSRDPQQYAGVASSVAEGRQRARSRANSLTPTKRHSQMELEASGLVLQPLVALHAEGDGAAGTERRGSRAPVGRGRKSSAAALSIALTENVDRMARRRSRALSASAPEQLLGNAQYEDDIEEQAAKAAAKVASAGGRSRSNSQVAL